MAETAAAWQRQKHIYLEFENYKWMRFAANSVRNTVVTLNEDKKKIENFVSTQCLGLSMWWKQYIGSRPTLTTTKVRALWSYIRNRVINVRLFVLFWVGSAAGAHRNLVWIVSGAETINNATYVSGVNKIHYNFAARFRMRKLFTYTQRCRIYIVNQYEIRNFFIFGFALKMKLNKNAATWSRQIR